MKKTVNLTSATISLIIAIGLLLSGLFKSMFADAEKYDIAISSIINPNPFMEISFGLVMVVVSMYFFHNYKTGA